MHHMTLSAKFATAISLVTLLAFAGLIPLGRWHDEYFTLYHFHESGFPYLGERLLRWSPRPLSELLAYTYALAVYRFDSPLITEFLAIFWLMFVAAALWPVLHNDRAFLCASVLVALLLLGHPVAEVFYWPFATVAYLPTVAAALLLLTLDWGDQIGGLSGNAWIFFVLTIAAASSEVGALFSAIYVVLLLTTRSTEDGRGHLIFAFPLLLSGTVLYLQFTGRVATGGEVFGDPSVAHHPIATMSAVAKHLPFELLKGDSGHHAFTLLTSGLATKLLFFFGVYIVMSAKRECAPRIQKRRLILAAAAIATATLTLAAALYNFGSTCCERHATIRQEYVFIAVGSIASYVAARWPSRSGRHAGLLLVCALLIPLAVAIPKLKTEYTGYAERLHANNQTWQSGRSSGSILRIEQAAPGPISGGQVIAQGTYQSGSPATNDVPWMLVFFGKKSAVVTAPNGEQSNDMRR
jgi:hypothetical protein